MNNDSRMKVVQQFYVSFPYYNQAKEFLNCYAGDATLMAWPYIGKERPFIISVSVVGEFCKLEV